MQCRIVGNRKDLGRFFCTVKHICKFCCARRNTVLFVKRNYVSLCTCKNGSCRHCSRYKINTSYTLPVKKTFSTIFFLAPCYYRLSLIRTPNRGPESVRSNGSWLYNVYGIFTCNPLKSSPKRSITPPPGANQMMQTSSVPNKNSLLSKVVYNTPTVWTQWHSRSCSI